MWADNSEKAEALAGIVVAAAGAWPDLTRCGFTAPNSGQSAASASITVHRTWARLAGRKALAGIVADLKRCAFTAASSGQVHSSASIADARAWAGLAAYIRAGRRSSGEPCRGCCAVSVSSPCRCSSKLLFR